jgi:hypothetical protein
MPTGPFRACALALGVVGAIGRGGHPGSKKGKRSNKGRNAMAKASRKANRGKS